ncbi:hypothetical protein GJ496_000383, partial [Pomphorhynchus laevis]
NQKSLIRLSSKHLNSLINIYVPRFGKKMHKLFEKSLSSNAARQRTASCSIAFETVNSLHHLLSLDMERSPFARHTSIIATLGPSTHSVEMLKEIFRAGVSIARLNFSHGSHEYHAESIANVREAQRQLDLSRPIAIALDTKGPEIRTGLLKEDKTGVELDVGDIVHITTDPQYESCSTKENIYVTYSKIAETLNVNNLIFIDDGLISLKVVETNKKDSIKCSVVNGGILGSRKGVNLPGIAVDLPVVSEKDIQDLQFGIVQDVDIVFASFIQNANAVRQIREVLGESGKHIKIISKIENFEALDNIDSIIDESDGIMVARGDLGIEIPPQKVFVAQKTIIARCNKAGKPVICATQMLESMTYNPRPTRAEVSDVANAVLDGADCIMLSGESAKGKYPVQCVMLMHEIAKEAEACVFYREISENLRYFTPPPLEALDATAIAAVEASFRVHAPIIIVLTSTGRSAILLSKFRPRSIIIAVTRDARAARMLNLYRGCLAIHFKVQRKEISTSRDLPIKQTNFTSCQDSVHLEEWMHDIDLRVKEGLKVAKQKGIVSTNEPIVVVTGWRAGAGLTNTIRIMYCD